MLTLSFLFGCSSKAASPNACPVAKGDPASKQTSQGNEEQSAFAGTSSEFVNFVSSLGQANGEERITRLEEYRTRLLGSPTEKQLSAYLLGRQLQQSSKPEQRQEAISLFEEASSHLDLGNRARLHGATTAFSLNDETKAQALLSPVFTAVSEEIKRQSRKQNSKSTPQIILTAGERKTQAEIIYRLAESYVRSQNFRSGVEAFLLVRNAFPKSEYATGAAYHLGNLALKQDQNGKRASQYYRIYLKASPGGKFAPEIGKQLLAMEAASENPLTLSASDHDLIAYAFYKHTLWSLALKQWSETGNKHILAAACLLKSGQKKEAILALISAAKANPQDPLINNVATEMCKSLSSAEALSLWKQVLAVKPEKIDEILWNIARRSGSAAPGYYQQIVSAYPNSTYAPESLWWLIWDHAIHGYKQKGAAAVAHFSKAAAYCAQGLKLHQNSEAAPRYAFWLGKFQEKLGKLALAKDIYRQTAKQYAGTYYGYRSAHRLKHLESLKKSSKVVPDRKWQIVLRPSPNPAWRWPEPPQFFNWQTLPAAIGPTASILASIGEYDECLELLPAVSPVNFKSWLLRHAGQPMRALGTVSYKLTGYPAKDLRWQFAYPLAYAQEIGQEASKRGLDPLLVHGLIRQESRYDPQALSRSKAMGLMQLLVGTAYGTAKHNGIALANKEQIFQPATNIQLGCSYLAYVLKRNNLNAMLAVASYNGGPNAVKKWVARHRKEGFNDMDIYVENIPYKETRGYVRKVFANYWNYESLYAR